VTAMDVALAQPQGFCAGVVKAIKFVELTLARLLIDCPLGPYLVEHHSLRSPCKNALHPG
jgi:hypothetical protein